MLGYIAHGIANPFARLWLATSSQSWRTLPRPTDAPLVHAAGSDSDRILLAGSGISVGYGVVSHDLALAGHLARELSAVTGRGATVNVIGNSDMSPSTTWAHLESVDLSRFDALVLTLGGLETMTLMPPELWRRQLDELLDKLVTATPASLEIFVVETGVPLLTGLPKGVRRVVGRHATAINAEARAATEGRSRTTFVAFDPAVGDLATLTGRSTYRDWAELIAPAVARVLDDDVRTRHPVTVDEALRQEALDSLDLDAVPDEELDRIVANARDLFGAAGASVTIIDHDMQRTKAAIGMPSSPIPRSLSICDQTIRRAELFVVEDTMTDPRVAGSPWATGERVRFYAGYPVESPDGQRIGALCVVDTAPRAFSDTDAALLRQLALRVQSALWGHRAAR